MAELLGADQVRSALGSRTGWSGGTAQISRTVTFPDFPTAVEAVRQVAEVAEELDHHPDMDIRWRQVTFHCATHSAGGVTAKDVDLAEHIDRIVTDAGGTDPAPAGA